MGRYYYELISFIFVNINATNTYNPTTLLLFYNSNYKVDKNCKMVLIMITIDKEFEYILVPNFLIYIDKIVAVVNYIIFPPTFRFTPAWSR